MISDLLSVSLLTEWSPTMLPQFSKLSTLLDLFLFRYLPRAVSLMMKIFISLLILNDRIWKGYTVPKCLCRPFWKQEFLYTYKIFGESFLNLFFFFNALLKIFFNALLKFCIIFELKKLRKILGTEIFLTHFSICIVLQFPDIFQFMEMSGKEESVENELFLVISWKCFHYNVLQFISVIFHAVLLTLIWNKFSFCAKKHKKT